MLALHWQHKNSYLRLMRTEKPIGTLLVAWPTLWALWLASGGIPDTVLLIVFMLGAFLMRSAGCVINDYADRHVDAHVERTQHRPLARGEVSGTEALQLFALLCLLAASLLLLTNLQTALLAIVAVALASLYPFMKRYTHLPQVVLGMAFSWAIPMAFAATTGSVPNAVWPLYIAVTCWVVAYDTFYAMVDRVDDLKIGVKSTAILFGRYDRAITAALQLATLALLWYVGEQFALGTPFLQSLAAAALLFIYQQRLVFHRQAANCFKAFMNNNYVGMVVFIGIAADYALR